MTSLQSQGFHSLDGLVEQAGVLVLKGSLVMQLHISQKLHKGWRSLPPQLPLWLWAAYSQSLWSYSCSPMFHQVKWFSSCGIRNSEGVWGSPRARPNQDKGSWDREGQEQRWMFWVIPGSRGKIIGCDSLQRRSWFWSLVWGVCKACVEIELVSVEMGQSKTMRPLGDR